MSIDIKRLTQDDKGRPVAYTPHHVPDGCTGHPSVEYGNISSWNEHYIFVKYVRNGLLQETAQATSPVDLEWSS